MARRAKSTSMCNGMKHFSLNLVVDAHTRHTITQIETETDGREREKSAQEEREKRATKSVE